MKLNKHTFRKDIIISDLKVIQNITYYRRNYEKRERTYFEHRLQMTSVALLQPEDLVFLR